MKIPTALDYLAMVPHPTQPDILFAAMVDRINEGLYFLFD